MLWKVLAGGSGQLARKSVKVNGTGGGRRPCPAQLQYTACVLNDGARFEDGVGRAGGLPAEWKGVQRCRLSRNGGTNRTDCLGG
jgi:hypothetical protein